MVLPAIAGTVALLILADGDARKLVAFSIYGAMLILLFTASSLHHGLSEQSNSRLWIKMDHISIYLMIAGSYTPFTLVTLQGGWGWSIFGIIWGMALAGVLLDALHRKGSRHPQLLLYLAMGWLILIAIHPLASTLETAGLIWLAAGGMTYTVGVLFFIMDERWRWAHGVWHLFVIGGALCHYIDILLYVA